MIRDTLDLVRAEYSNSEFTSLDKSCVNKARDRTFIQCHILKYAGQRMLKLMICTLEHNIMPDDAL